MNFRMRGTEKHARPTQAPGQPILTNYENFLKQFPQKKLTEVEKIDIAVFHSRHWVKVELSRECGKSTSNTESKGYL